MLGLLYFVIHTVIQLYIWVVIISSLLTFVQPDPNNQIVMALDRLSRPTLDFIREKMPFVVVAGIDLSPVVVVIGLEVVDGIIKYILLG